MNIWIKSMIIINIKLCNHLLRKHLIIFLCWPFMQVLRIKNGRTGLKKSSKLSSHMWSWTKKRIMIGSKFNPATKKEQPGLELVLLFIIWFDTSSNFNLRFLPTTQAVQLSYNFLNLRGKQWKCTEVEKSAKISISLLYGQRTHPNLELHMLLPFL